VNSAHATKLPTGCWPYVQSCGIVCFRARDYAGDNLGGR
jgi:hypothetical protein